MNRLINYLTKKHTTLQSCLSRKFSTQIDCESANLPISFHFAQIRADFHWERSSVKLPRESKASCDTRLYDWDEVVQIAIGGCRQLECPEADVVEGLIIYAKSLIWVFDKLMDGQRCIVRLIIELVVSKCSQTKMSILPQRQCPKPLDWAQQSMCTSSCRDIPRGLQFHMFIVSDNHALLRWDRPR